MGYKSDEAKYSVFIGKPLMNEPILYRLNGGFDTNGREAGN